MMKPRRFRFGMFTSRVYLKEDFELALPDRPSVLVFDEHTHPLFGGSVGDAADSPILVLPAGEWSKVWPQVESILKAAVQGGLSRDDLFVGIGGGVLCDIVAMAASLYMRGSRLALIPTTLLAMVDAAVGGKTGIDFMGYKNLIGTFYPAEEVRIHTSALRTLPERHYRCGLAEVMKTALLGDEELFRLLKERKDKILERDPPLLMTVIGRCVDVKGRIVEEDFRETAPDQDSSPSRAHLNLGHTFAHALESVQGFKGMSHGEAVAWGIARAMDLGLALGKTDPSYVEEVKELLRLYGFRVEPYISEGGDLLSAMGKDKKRRESKLRFVIQRGLGQTEVVEVAEDQLAEILGREGADAHQ